ncbi:MAG: rod shape-determining protein [Acidiferrobacterales bacterium]|nr:rod shape-determining protein [Acidiferrobacterales bacterium]
MQLIDRLSQDLAIDLGTANTLIFEKNSKKIILNEPSVVAVHVPDFDGKSYKNPVNSVLAIGSDAKSMLGRTPANIRAIRPMKDGVIADFTVTEIMLKRFIGKVQTRRFFLRPRVVISVPCGSTQVERRAIRESCLGAGARQVYLMEEPMAVAVGMNLPVDEPVGTMVVDIGGGTTEIGIISLGGLVWSNTIRVAGDLFDLKIKDYLRDQYGLEVGLPTAERIKHLIGTAWNRSDETQMDVRGRGFRGVTRRHVIRSSEIYEVLNGSMEEIVNGVGQALQNSPPELNVDISDRGILLAGGGALLRDIDKRLNEALDIPVIIAEDPLTCVARGCGKVFERDDLLNQIAHDR